MKGEQNIIFIEWYPYRTVMFGKRQEATHWAKLPDFVFRLLTTKHEATGRNKHAIIMHWDHNIFTELYQHCGWEYSQFTYDVKLLFSELLTHREHRTLFIFGTDEILLPIRGAIRRADVLPDLHFTESYVHRNCIGGETYLVHFDQWHEAYLVKIPQAEQQLLIARKPRLQ